MKCLLQYWVYIIVYLVSPSFEYSALIFVGCPGVGSVKANPWLKFNLLFLFVCFCMPVYFEALKKTFIHPDKISEEIFLICLQV